MRHLIYKGDVVETINTTTTTTITTEPPLLPLSVQFNGMNGSNYVYCATFPNLIDYGFGSYYDLYLVDGTYYHNFSTGCCATFAVNPLTDTNVRRLVYYYTDYGFADKLKQLF